MAQAPDRVTSLEVREAIFPKPPMGKQGYDEKSVGNFLQLAVRRLEGRGRLSAADVREITFPRARIFKRGYNEDAVDDLLDRIAATIDGMGGS